MFCIQRLPIRPSATQLMVKHFSLIYTCLFSSSGAPSPSSLSLRLLLLLVPRWSWILGKQIQDSKTVLITRGDRGNSLIPCVPESSIMGVLNMSSSTVAAHCLHNFGFINISHKATLVIKEKRIAFRALTSNLNFYTLWPTWWVSH